MSLLLLMIDNKSESPTDWGWGGGGGGGHAWIGLRTAVYENLIANYKKLSVK